MKRNKLTRRSFLRSTGAASLALGMGGANAASQRRSLQKVGGARPRNVVFILADDHRFDFMGFMGKVKFLETHNMDRMAREGAHLANAFVTTALCSPSRASILTGQFSHKHGVVDNQTDIQPGLVFFPEYLRQLGCETAFMGKWHMGHDSDEPRPGFDRWISFRGQGEYYNGTLNVDIAPTILEAAGAKPPEHMDGQSILPLLEGKDVPWRDAVFYEYYWEANYPHTPTTFGVRTDRYKFIHYHGVWETDELYDVRNDPDEMHNLIDKPEHRSLVADLRKRVYDWLETTNGLQIPLRREIGGKSDRRGLKAVKELRFYEQNK